ncbi:MAG: carotenoid oxygenase family protein [Rubrivivax sp.]
MAKPLSRDAGDDPFKRGYYAPIRLEADASHLPIVGKLPPTLRGTLYRVGPNPRFAARGPQHWFAGDGMLHVFHIERGAVSYRNRWVRTPKWELENAVGEGLSSGSLGPSPLTDPRLAALKSTVANTNVVWHAGRLLALEEGHAPFEVDPQSLAAIGPQTFEGQLEGPMTAHPKIDPSNGELLSFGYSTRGPLGADMTLHVIARDGRMLRQEHFTAPYPSMVHDFAVTQGHIVFPIFPLTGSMQRAMRGQPPYAWEPDRGTHIGIMPREGSSAGMRWFRGEPCYVYHPMNAFDTADGTLVLDVMKYDAPPGFPMPDGKPIPTQRSGARLVRWTFDLRGESDRYTERVLSDLTGEFPRLDERFAIRPYRHGYIMAASIAETVSGGRDSRAGIAHIDVESGKVSQWQPELGDYCGEPIFVERSAGAVEGDGWLLSLVYRGREDRSDLAVFDACDVAAGPVALVQLSHRVPAGLHGNWRAAAD